VACGTAKGTVGTSLFGLILNVGFTVFKGKNALSIASPFSILGAILRALAAVENLEQCAELQGINVDELRRQREHLQREVEELQRTLDQQQQQQQQQGAH
jgi:TolA-binding protein